MLDQSLQIGETELRPDFETELSRLDGNLNLQPARVDRVQHVALVPRHGLRVVGTREVLAQLCQKRRDALTSQHRRRTHRIGEMLAGHEGRDGPPDERGPRRAFAKPVVGGCREEEASCQTEHTRYYPVWPTRSAYCRIMTSGRPDTELRRRCATF